MEEKIKDIYWKINVFTNQLTPTQINPKKTMQIHNKVPRKNYNYLRNMRETPKNNKAYKILKKCGETC